MEKCKHEVVSNTLHPYCMECGIDPELESWEALMEPCPECGESGFDCECPSTCPKCDAPLEVKVHGGYAGEHITETTCSSCGWSEVEDDFALWMIK